MEIYKNILKRDSYEKLFPGDKMSKRERVERTLNHQPVDRAALHEQLSLNPGVISLYTGKNTEGFSYNIDDIGMVIRKTMDTCFPFRNPLGTARFVDEDGFTRQYDNWTTWHVGRPFDDVEGARRWLAGKTDILRKAEFDADKGRTEFRKWFLNLQSKVGETVIISSSETGMCSVFDSMGLELFTFFYLDYPEEMTEFMEASTEWEIKRIKAIADRELSPVILIPEDFSTKQGPIFGPEFLKKQHYPYIKKLTDVWHSYNIRVIYHSDGNYKKAIPDLMNCGVDGFYCLEPSCGMDVVELKKKWPEMVWAGGVDGVQLMESGTPEEVRNEVRRHIFETDVLQTGGMFVATSSEINPPIKPENFKAMVDAVGEIYNPLF